MLDFCLDLMAATTIAAFVFWLLLLPVKRGKK
jgi:hypothetical protein